MLIYAIIFLVILSRIIPHLPNAAAITAIAIFSATYLPKKQAVIITFGARFLSDLILGFFSWPLMLAVYGAHGLGLLWGLWLRRQNLEAKPVKAAGFGALAGGSSAILFFLITNFALLYGSYPHTMAGIATAYANGLPFLRGTLIGDIGYATALVGGYELVRLWQRHAVSKKSLLKIKTTL